MSFHYAASLYPTAAAAATACAYDYVTGCGGAPVARLRELAAMTDDELDAVLDGAEADDWRISDDDGEWDEADVSNSALRIMIVHALPADERCHHCGDELATVASTFCHRCVDDPSAWDATDEDLLERLGRTECAAWREVALRNGDLETVEAIDRTMGCCHCEATAVERMCEDCGATALVIDCGHHVQPAAISADEHGRELCDVCHSARVEASETAQRLDDELPDDGPTGLFARAEADYVLLADDWASVQLTAAQARELAATLAEMEEGDEKRSSSWVWEWITAHGISRQ